MNKYDILKQLEAGELSVEEAMKQLEQVPDSSKEVPTQTSTEKKFDDLSEFYSDDNDDFGDDDGFEKDDDHFFQNININLSEIGEQISASTTKVVEKLSQKSAEMAEKIKSSKKEESNMNERPSQMELGIHSDIRIKTRYSSIMVEESDVEELTLNFRDPKTQALLPQPKNITIDVKDHTVTVREENEPFFNDLANIFTASSNKKSITLELLVPKHTKLDVLRLKTTSGKIGVIGCKINKMKLSNVSGKTSVAENKIKNIIINTVSGSVMLEEIKTKTLNVKAASGTISVNGSVKKINAETISGSIRCRSTDILQDSSLSSVSGNVRVFIPDLNVQNYEASSVSSKACAGNIRERSLHHREGVAHSYLSVNTVSGKIEIND